MAFRFPIPAVLESPGFPCVAMIWWCFAGFETCCAMGEEIRHPQINLPRALFLAPFRFRCYRPIPMGLGVYIIPTESLATLAEAAAPYAEGMKLAGIVGFPLVLLCLGIAFGGDFSTLNASVAARRGISTPWPRMDRCLIFANFTLLIRRRYWLSWF